LEKLGLLAIGVGLREDRREKSVALTDQSREILRNLRDSLREFN
jgi:DNA-binding MarR family transcriptional regulator